MNKIQAITDYLNSNLNKNVVDIMPGYLLLAKTSKRGENYIKIGDTTVAVLCSYHNVWEPIIGDNAIIYKGRNTDAKKTSGLYQSCTLGTKQGYAQKKAYNEEKEKSLAQFMDTLINGDEYRKRLHEIELSFSKSSPLPKDIVRFSNRLEVENYVNGLHEKNPDILKPKPEVVELELVSETAEAQDNSKAVEVQEKPEDKKGKTNAKDKAFAKKASKLK